MGFGRGLFLGFLAGAIGLLLSRRSRVETPSAGGEGVAAPPDGAPASLLGLAWQEGRDADHAARAALRARFEEARRTGRLPEDPGD